MNEMDVWIAKVLQMVPAHEISHCGNTKHQAVANFYRFHLGLPTLDSHEEAVVFIEELFRIPLQELLEIPTLMSEK